MDENKNQNQSARDDFKEWLKGGLELVKPWKLALILTNAFWAFVLAVFIWFAYMSPDTTYQHQDFTDQAQTQSSGTEVPAVTGGE